MKSFSNTHCNCIEIKPHDTHSLWKLVSATQYKVNCNYLSLNSDFFLTVVRYKLAIEHNRQFSKNSINFLHREIDSTFNDKPLKSLPLKITKLPLKIPPIRDANDVIEYDLEILKYLNIYMHILQ